MSGSIADNPYRASGVVAAASAGGISWQSVETGATFTAEAGNGYPVNTTAQACTVTLPASASVGDEIIFTDYARNWGTNALTIDQNSLKYQGNTSPNPEYDTDGESVHIVYMDATNGWIPTYDGAVADEVPQAYNIEYFMIAGGAAGCRGNSGGGGAGGYKTATGLALSPGTVYTAAIGTGGADAAAVDNQSADGVDTTFSGTALAGTPITTTKGGGGGTGTANGRDGGSGGGGGHSGGLGGSGTAGQGYDGGDCSPATGGPQYGGGGAGGAGEVGAVGASAGGGDGGDGVASDILVTSSDVTYGGGGGGSSDASTASAGAGGAGGGGPGAGSDNGSGTYCDATIANSGSGGGGGYGGGGAGNGADGCVILRVPTASYSGTTSGSPTITTNGTDTVIRFNGDGTYTG